MKTLIVLLLFLTPLFSCGQKYFEGSIEYNNQTIKKDPSFDLNRIPCGNSKSTKIIYKNGDFISRLDNCYVEYQYFNHTLNQIFYKLHDSDTLLVQNYDKDPPETDSLISVTKYEHTDTVLNRICNQIVLQMKKSKLTFVYSPDLKTNPDWFKNSRGGYYDVIYGQMKSVFLKYIIEGDGYVSTAIATKINFQHIENDAFPKVTMLPQTPL